jgi:hypothetical protein
MVPAFLAAKKILAKIILFSATEKYCQKYVLLLLAKKLPKIDLIFGEIFLAADYHQK